MVILVQLFIVMFGLDLSFVILVPERKRGIDTGIQENFDSLFDLDIRVKPEYDRKRKSAKASGTRMTMDGSSPNMTIMGRFGYSGQARI